MTEELMERESIEVDKRIHDYEGFIDLGINLKKMRDDRLYEKLGFGGFEEYISQSTFAFKRSPVYAFIGIVEDYIISKMLTKEEAKQIGWTKLNKIRSFRKTKNFYKLLKMAKGLSGSQLMKAIRKYKNSSLQSFSIEIWMEELEVKKVGICPICKDVNVKLIEHHVCYKPEYTILVCRRCHRYCHNQVTQLGGSR